MNLCPRFRSSLIKGLLVIDHGQAHHAHARFEVAHAVETLIVTNFILKHEMGWPAG